MATLASRISDLAGAIRDKFNQIMPRLLPPGGNTGQVLSKASNADNSFQWSTVTSGIPSVSADTAPSLGGVLTLNGYDLTSKMAVNGTQFIKAVHPSTGSGYSGLFSAHATKPIQVMYRELRCLIRWTPQRRVAYFSMRRIISFATPQATSSSRSRRLTDCVDNT
ncbi:hypothetical protein MOP88_07275 [Sphingomonas sp. WKB10]|nr:hypothetical protein [Sphingomonas sp. WKB10]